MPPTDSFALPIATTQPAARAPVRAAGEMRAMGLALLTTFVVGAAAAAAGISLEADGYGALTIAGGAFFLTAATVPLVWLLRKPRTLR